MKSFSNRTFFAALGVAFATILGGCASDEGCPSGYAEDERGICVAGCPDGRVLSDEGICVVSDTSDCCVANPPAWCDDIAITGCGIDTSECRDDIECPDGTECRDGTCRRPFIDEDLERPCSSEDDCAFGESCVSGFCSGSGAVEQEPIEYWFEPAVVLLTPERLTADLIVVDRLGNRVDLSQVNHGVETSGGLPGLELRLDAATLSVPDFVVGSTVVTLTEINDLPVSSAPLTIIMADPAGDAALYLDADLLGPVEPLTPDLALGPGAEWAVPLSDQVAVRVGDLLLPAESSPFAGRVLDVEASTSRGQNTVVIEYVNPHEMFDAIAIDATLPAAIPSADTWTVPNGWQAELGPNGEITLQPSQQKSIADICTVDGDVAQVTLTTPRFTISNTLDVRVVWEDDHKEVALAGSVSSKLTVGGIQFEVSPGVDIKCDIPVMSIPLTAAGVLGSFLGVPELSLGGRLQLTGEVSAFSIGGSIDVSTSNSVVIGFRCLRGDCGFLTDARSTGLTDASSFDVQWPDSAASVSGKIGLYAVVALVSDPLYARQRKLLEARVGVVADLTWAPMSVQLSSNGAESEYELKLTGRVGFPTESGAIEQIGDWLDLEIRLPSAEFNLSLGGTPDGNLTASTTTPDVGDNVTFTSRFEQTNLVGFYNLSEVVLYAANRGAVPVTGTQVASTTVPSGSSSATLSWRPTSTGTVTLVALARPRFFSFLGLMRLGEVTLNVGGSSTDCPDDGVCDQACHNLQYDPDCDNGGECACDYTGGTCEAAARGSSAECACDPDCVGAAAACGSDRYCDTLCITDPDCGGGTPVDAEWVLIEAGTFMMGSPETELGRVDDETQHRVTLTRDFYIMNTEVTQEMWQSLMGNNPSYFGDCGGDCPVDSVNWYEAVAYANALSRADGYPECYASSGCTNSPGENMECDSVTVVGGNPYACRGYRLPTEAEWEYAARAGDSRATYNGNLTETDCSDSTLLSIAWFCGNSDDRTHPVGQKRPNAWGLYDMLGSVWEWTWDWYGTYSGTATDPTGAATGSDRLLRGGSISSSGGASDARAALRASLGPDDNWLYGLGFRLARSSP